MINEYHNDINLSNMIIPNFFKDKKKLSYDVWVNKNINDINYIFDIFCDISNHYGIRFYKKDICNIYDEFVYSLYLTNY